MIERVGALVGSLIVHASVALALTGHAPTRENVERADTLEFELAEQPAPAALAAPGPEPVRTRAAKTARTTHHHAYPVPASHDAQPHDPLLMHAPLVAAPQVPHAELAQAASAPHFVLALPAHAVRTQAAFASVAGAGAHTHEAEDAFAEQAVDRPARLISGATPAYPAAARAAQVEADVALELVVSATGRVLSAHVLRPAGYGLDTAALLSMRAARFAPAVHDGRAVAVRMQWTVLFRLQ